MFDIRRQIFDIRSSKKSVGRETVTSEVRFLWRLMMYKRVAESQRGYYSSRANNTLKNLESFISEGFKRGKQGAPGIRSAPCITGLWQPSVHSDVAF